MSRVDGLPAEELWTRVLHVVNSCSNQGFLNIQGYMNKDEVKFHAMPLHMITAPQLCTIISLGVGKDIGAEEGMKRHLPNCSFFGADPVGKVNSQLYSTIGTFFHTAIGAKEGQFLATVLEGDALSYTNWVVEHKDLFHFIETDVRRKFIDQIMIDIEYAEYGLLRQLLRRNRKSTVVICQINIEIHSGDIVQKAVFHSFFTQLLEEHEYVPLRAATMEGHLRLYLLNVANKKCRSRYLMLEE